GKAGEEGFLAEAYRLGLGEPVGISAAHGEGMAELYEALVPYGKLHETRHCEGEVPKQSRVDCDIRPWIASPPARNDGSHKTIQIAIVGRPNVGKSTLINTLLKEE